MSDPLTNSVNLQADSISTWDPVARRYVDLRNSVAAQATTYSKTEVDARLASKADQAALDGKADQTDLLAVSAGLAGKQDTLTFAAPLSLSGGTVGVDLSGKAEQSDLLAVTAALASKQDALSFAAPLSLSGSTLGVDYSGSTLSVDTIQTAGGLTLDAAGVIVKGDLAVDSVLLASDIQPRSSDQVNLNSTVAITGDLTVTWGSDRAVNPRRGRGRDTSRDRAGGGVKAGRTDLCTASLLNRFYPRR